MPAANALGNLAVCLIAVAIGILGPDSGLNQRRDQQSQHVDLHCDLPGVSLSYLRIRDDQSRTPFFLPLLIL